MAPFCGNPATSFKHLTQAIDWDMFLLDSPKSELRPLTFWGRKLYFFCIET